MRALIIEDNDEQARRVSLRLTQEGFDCVLAQDGSAGFRKITSLAFDLAIVDVMLPKMNGFELIRRAREEGVSTPIIILSAKDELIDRISGLNFGADYYLAKPYSGDELLAAVNAVFRRAKPEGAKRKLTFEDIVLDPVCERVTRNGHEIVLPPHEYKLLKYLMQNPELCISGDAIVLRAWHYDFIPSTNIVSPRVYALRKKLTAFGGRDVIHCERGNGYVLR